MSDDEEIVYGEQTERDNGARKSNPVDVHVGSRVRLRRMLLSMSQEKLGELLSVTFQQVQKYEKGTNRISASRLHSLSKVLSVPVQFFFDNMPEQPVHAAQSAGFAEPLAESYVVDFLASRDGVELNRAFVAIQEPKVRRAVVELVRSLAGETSPP